MSETNSSTHSDASSDQVGPSEQPSFHHTRPRFNSLTTSDRLRESSRFWQPPFRMRSNLRKGRRSVFKELGLDDDDTNEGPGTPRPASSLTFVGRDKRSFTVATDDESDPETKRSGRARVDAEDNEAEPRQRARSSSGSPRPRQRQNSESARPWYAKLATSKGRPRVKTTSGAPPGSISGLNRFTMITLLIAVVIPTFSYCNGRTRVDISGADAGPVPMPVLRRADSPTDVCIRWAHQAAQVNGTLFIYGGQAKAESEQVEDTWNNNFLTLDLTKDWSTASPALKGLPIPDGPPSVALGALWNDYSSLYLYGGQFADNPYVEPGRESVWKYSISDQEWSEFSQPETSTGNYSESEGEPVRRAAEGASISVPELGLSWYFGGHLDLSTTPGWSTHTVRVYLKSLLEFTHPGYVNSGVDSLSGGTGAGKSGAFRNITAGGIQAEKYEAFSERADGVLVYVPGWGDQGVLIGLAGGTNDTFVEDLETLNVYDIANSEWFHQQTKGDIPGVRVNPCAVVASAPDASSFQIYLFGGQNLIPYGNQTQYNDMYILTIPAFTWIKVDQSNQDNVPRPRAGHTCHLRDSQMVVVGGYIGNQGECESPGIHVFDASSLKWQSNFKAGDHPDDYRFENLIEAGSYGYKVPDAVQEVIGGNEEGGATASKPSATATGGPFATGKPPVFTVTESGATATVTNWNPKGTSKGDGNDGSSDDNTNDNDMSPGLIAAAVIAGIAGAAALYLGWCAWLYRRQVNAYKQHVAAANRYPGVSNNSLAAGAALFGGARRHSSRRTQASAASWAWPGSDREPTWMSEPKWVPSDDHPSSSGTGSANGPKHSEDTRPGTSGSGSGQSTEGLLEGQEPSFFNVVMGPRRALRVVNGIDDR